MRSLALLLAISPALSAQCFVRTHDDHVVQRTLLNPGAATGPLAGITLCATQNRAWHGQVPSSGGTLSPLAFANPAAIDRDGRVAFFANVSGSTRNQGIFVADANGTRAIVLGCGAGGGSGNHGTCGDPAPGGGTFAGFFGGTPFVPAMNVRGDLLFVADIANGPSPRGLFLWKADSQTTQKIAAIGDVAPNGGTFKMMGPGSLNTSREIVFLASNAVGFTSDIYVWRNGTLTTCAKTGDAAPGGGTFSMLGTESFGFADGTSIPTGPVPAINERGQIAFRAITNGTSFTRGLLLSQNGVHQWQLKDGDPTPIGGAYLDFWAPCLNGLGQIACFCDLTTSTSAWIVGSPGSWRKAVAFYDALDGGQCLGLAVSRNPLTPLDDDGNLVFWADLSSAGGQERIAISAADGTLTVVARRGDVTPLGGTYTAMDAWPAASPVGRVTFGAATPGAGGGTFLNARFVGVYCGPGVNAMSAATLGGTLRVEDYGPSGSSFALFVSSASTNQALPPLGTLLIGPSPIVQVLGLTPYPGTSAAHSLPLAVPNDAALLNAKLYFQSIAVQGPTATLTNRTETRMR